MSKKDKEIKENNELKNQNDIDNNIENNENDENIIDEKQNEELIEDLKNKITELEGQIEDDKLRKIAEIQNLNKRHKKELDDAYKYASYNFAKEMLSIKDFLEMALKDQSGNFEMLKMGVEMTLKQLNTTFEKSHIKEIEASIGDEIDPNLHHVMSLEESEKNSNTIIKIMQKGYKFNERILRPTMVVASTAKDEKKSTENSKNLPEENKDESKD